MEYQQFNQAEYPVTTKLKHSGPGIASFIVVLAAIFGYIVALGIIISLVYNVVDQSTDAIIESLEQHSGIIAGGLMFILASVLNLIALILGIIGLAIKNRKKVFAILGTVFSGIALFAVILMFLGSFIA
ncbi:hypothetical protein D3C76_152000 [compost metagenome]